MLKYNKAAFAALVGALAVIINEFSDLEISSAVQAAVVTIIVFVVPNESV